MERPPLPAPLREWAKDQNLPEYEWRKPGVADYDANADTWLVDGILTLRFAVETHEERYYCGLYQGPLEPHPVMYWVVLHHAMAPKKEQAQ